MTLLGTTPKAFTAQKEFTLEAIPNVRYITKGQYSESKVTLWIEKFPSGEVVTQKLTGPVTWININVQIY